MHRTIHPSERERKRSTTKVSTFAALPQLLSSVYDVAEKYTLRSFLSSPHSWSALSSASACCCEFWSLRPITWDPLLPGLYR